MDDTREYGSWIAFTVYLEYFPELKNSSEYILAKKEHHCFMFRLGHHLNADLPFILDKLLPYVTLEDLKEARSQLEHTKRQIAHYDHVRNNYDPAVIQTLSDKLDQAIITRLNSSPSPASLN